MAVELTHSLDFRVIVQIRRSCDDVEDLEWKPEIQKKQKNRETK